MKQLETILGTIKWNGIYAADVANDTSRLVRFKRVGNVRQKFILCLSGLHQKTEPFRNKGVVERYVSLTLRYVDIIIYR